jgi:hypothetical protein
MACVSALPRISTWPSAGARATAWVPTAPFAPARLSTTTGWPSGRAMAGPSARIRISANPPGFHRSRRPDLPSAECRAQASSGTSRSGTGAQEKYLYSHKWTPGDVLMWDNIATTHNAVADYGPDEPRFILRVQVMATLDYGRLAA